MPSLPTTPNSTGEAIGTLASMVARAIRIAARELDRQHEETSRAERARSLTARIARDATGPKVPAGSLSRARRFADDVYAMADAIHNLHALAASQDRSRLVAYHRKLFDSLLRRFGTDRCQRYGLDPERVQACLDHLEPTPA